MKNNKLLFSPYNLQSFVSIKSSGKSEKPRGQENNLVEKWEPIDSSDSQRHRAAEQLRARCQWTLEPSFPGTVSQGNLRMEGPVSKKCSKNLGGVGGDSTGISWRLRSENMGIGLGSRERRECCLQPVQTTVKANPINAFPVMLVCLCSITMFLQEYKAKKVQWSSKSKQLECR